MANLATALKDEIRRLAKKETKTQIAQLKSASAKYRSDMAELKRANKELAQKVARLEKAQRKSPDAEPTEPDSGQVRFASQWVRNHREKVCLSQADYGTLVGVSALTIYNWEKGNSRPRQKQLMAWGAIKKLGKREAWARLEEL